MKIGFISTYKELTDIVKEISTEMDLQVDVFEGALEKGVEIVLKLEKEGYDIVISRGATCSAIAKKASIPVVNCGTTSFDILYALYDAIKISNNIALIIYESLPFNYQLISEIFDINLIYMTAYTNIDELQKMVEEAMKKGADVVIGGILTKQYAQELGCQSILLKTSEETIRQSICNAVEIVNLSREQILEAEKFKQIINFSYDGIIGIDAQGIVNVFNPAAEAILGIKAADIINSRADEFIPTTKLLEVAATAEPQIGRIQKVNKATIITNRIPIIVNEEILGVIATFHDITKIQDWEMKIRNEVYQKGLVAKYSFKDYVGSSEKIKKLITKAKKFTQSDSTILIMGESGTGKEILAQSIHNAGKRKDYPFVAVNCTAISEHLLESELFGYDEGAFTGAKKGGKPGLFELAHMGTIFLDEIGSISKNLQANLLRVLQEKEVRRIGSNKVVKIDVRVIAATNNNLLLAIEKASFRQDLYYRLNVLSLQTMPLRERKEDILELFRYFIKVYGGSSKFYISKENERLLKEYSWPGNVRELQNVVERFMLLKDEISLQEVLEELLAGPQKIRRDNIDSNNTLTLEKASLKEMENEIILELFEEYQGNTTLMAERLKISRTTLWKRLKELKAKR